MQKATIIIPFLNEEDEPLKTINNIYETANSNDFEILLIHDNYSQPTFKLPSYKNFKLIRNPCRMGVSGSRDIGVMYATYPNIILLDAHMRFYNNYWLNILVDQLQKTPLAIVTPVSKDVKDDRIDFESNSGRGCKILMDNQVTSTNDIDNTILTAKWDVELMYNEQPEIQCVMGGCYAITKQQYEHLDGFRGLYRIGSSEVYLSLKNWLFGGSCINLPYLHVGHKYKKISNVNYECMGWYKIYNRMVAVYTLFPDKLVEPAIDRMRSINCPKEMQTLLKTNFFSIMSQRKHYQALIKRDIDWFCEYFKINRFWK